MKSNEYTKIDSGQLVISKSLDSLYITNNNKIYNNNVKKISEKQWTRRYELMEILGEGNFGVTYLARDKKNAKEVAIKIIDISKPNMNLNKSLRELKSLNDLAKQGLYDIDNDGCHPYISCYYDGFINKVYL
jgi:serine/threonine protein kinase